MALIFCSENCSAALLVTRNTFSSLSSWGSIEEFLHIRAEVTFVFPMVEIFVILVPEEEWLGSFSRVKAFLVVFWTWHVIKTCSSYSSMTSLKRRFVRRTGSSEVQNLYLLNQEVERLLLNHLPVRGHVISLLLPSCPDFKTKPWP